MAVTLPVAQDPTTFCATMLPRVSRTFAVGIRLLPQLLAAPVTIGYLLCRIADTVEDDREIATARKLALLARFIECFDDVETAEGFAREASDAGMSEADRELVAGSSVVFAAYRSLDPSSRAILKEWIGELARGMALFVRSHPNGIRIADLPEFRQYCYYVAGTVGHLLTDLWHVHSGFVSARTHAKLTVHCEAFGEALQTVNILKDIPWDVERENAVYIPRDLLTAAGSDHHLLLEPANRAANRIALDGLLALAEADLNESIAYISLIPSMALRIRMFCVLPIAFAAATLREIRTSEAMFERGGSVKISRAEVKSLIVAGSTTSISNVSLRWLMQQVRRRPFLAGR